MHVNYFDTDSVIYVSKDGEWEPPTGSYLGELIDELEGGHITTFVSEVQKTMRMKQTLAKPCVKFEGLL